MAQRRHHSGWWGQQSWGQWPAEDAAKNFEEMMEKLQKKCDWLRETVNKQSEEMKRLDTQVALLGEENKSLKHRVAELEVAGSAVSTRTSDHEEDSPPPADASELPREEFAPIKWTPHPEAKPRSGGAGATSRSGDCRNCHGGMRLDLEKERELHEK